MCRYSSSNHYTKSNSSSSHFLFPPDFSGTVEDTDISNTLSRTVTTADVPFGGFLDIVTHFFVVKYRQKNNFGGHE